MAIRICIVEDDEGIRDVLKIVLEKAGYELNIFSDGEPILAKNYVLPDLYLLDKQLKTFDGLNLCEFLKVDPQSRNIPVILMSAYPGVRELALSAGADDFVEKPFRIQTLLKAIRAQIHEHPAAQPIK